MIVAIFCIVVSTLLLAVFSRGESRHFVQAATAALVAHVVGAFAQYWVQEVYYGISDFHPVTYYATPLVHALHLDFARFSPEVIKLGLHMEASLPGMEFTRGDSNTTMFAITAFTFFFVGISALPAFIVASLLNWAASVLLAKALAAEVKENERPIAYVAAMLVPSVAYWSSAMVKEGFVMSGLGILSYSARRTLVLREFRFAPGIVVGLLLIGLIKPYVLFPLVIAVAVWVFVARLNQRGEAPNLRLGPVVLAAILAVGGLLVVGALFPEFSVGRVAEQTAHQQQLWDQYDSSTSTIDLGEPMANRSLLGQVPYVLFALFNTMFRPVVFEARNAAMFAAAIESTVLTILVARMLWRFELATVRDAVLRSPIVAASLTFVLIFAIAVGLATLNLGSLSRYRLPMMPFYVLSVGLLSVRLRRRDNGYAGAIEDDDAPTADQCLAETGRRDA